MRLGEETHAQASSLCSGRILAGPGATVSAVSENARLTMMLDCNRNRHELRKTLRDQQPPLCCGQPHGCRQVAIERRWECRWASL